MTTFAEQFEVLKNNVNTAMVADLAERLGVTVEAINKLGAGFHFGEQAWCFAERDAKGDIVGLSYRRLENGFKYMAKGSKRGLIYAYNQDHSIGDKRYEAGKCHWIRIADAGIDCPVCGKPDWCRISSDYRDHEGPSAAACSRISEGSVREIPPDSHLHILDPDRQKTIANSVLTVIELPIIVVEGASDTLAAMSLGFVCIGRPSAKGGISILKEMPLAGREVWIVGDNDAGAGREGVKKTYGNIKGMTDNIQCLFPPEGIKDLRQWVERGLTQALLFEHAGSKADTTIAVDPNVFLDDIAANIADRFIDAWYTAENGTLLLRSYMEQWVEWNGFYWKDLHDKVLTGKIYTFLKGKKFLKATKTVIDQVPYKYTKAKVNDMLHSMTARCPIAVGSMMWIDGGKDRPKPKDLIRFKNGMLDVNEYIKGNIVLHNLDPNLFARNIIPYNFDEYVWSNWFDDKLNEWFDGDTECIRLLAEWYGYNVIPDMRKEKLMLFVGAPRSGKGTCCDVLQGIVGENQCTATSFQALAGTHGTSGLSGKLAAILGDAKTPKKGEADAALRVILEIVGGDKIKVNPKYIQAYDEKPICRFTVAVNTLPSFSDAAQAFVARSNILMFKHSYVGKEDSNIKEGLAREAKQGKMINFALWGLKNLRENGRFIVPAASGGQMEQLKRITSPTIVFVEECCRLDPGAFILRTQIYEAYEYWCSRTGHKKCNSTHFGRRLRQVSPGVIDFRPEIDGHQQRAYKGVTLQEWVYKEYMGNPSRR